MTALIDLDAYAQEVASFSALAEKFVPRVSSPALKRMEQELRTGIARARSTWTWSTAQAVVFATSSLYDAPGKTPKPAHFTLAFNCEFFRPANVTSRRAGAVWAVRHSSTRIRLEREDISAALKIHFDYKNAGQWGPQLHIQVDEAQSGGLPIPRLVTAAFLPTDCADVMLCELHPTEWERHQRAGNNQRNVAVIRDGQEHRTLAYLNDIHTQWESDRHRTRYSLLQSYNATVAALPAHSGRPAKKGW